MGGCRNAFGFGAMVATHGGKRGLHTVGEREAENGNANWSGCAWF